MNYDDIYKHYGDGLLPVSLIPQINLTEGGGDREDNTLCINQMVAWLDGDRNTDSPKCQSPAIGRLCIYLNDNAGQSVRDSLKERAVKMLDTNVRIYEQARIVALMRATVANINEMFLDVKDPKDREGLAPAIEALNASFEGEKSGFDVGQKWAVIKLDMDRWMEVAGTPLTVALAIFGLKYIYSSVLGSDAVNDLARVLSTADDYFGTRWENTRSEDPRDPVPGARALAALDQAIAVNRAL